MELTILLILLILIILVIKNYYKENFSVQEVNQEFKQSFINDLKKTIEGTVLYDDNIKIRKFNNSTKLIVSNISVANPLQDSFFNQNITLKDNHLKYNLQALEHKTNVFTGYYISKPIQTVKKNKNYGFVFEYNPEKSFNNEAEIIIDFTKQKKEALDNIENISAIKNSQSYINLPRKTVNVFTPMNTPLDIMPYFSKGDNDKDIKLLVLFYDQMNTDFLKSLPDGKFNILDNKLNPILVNCQIDTPYCNIGLKKGGKILGREKYVIGKFNPILNKYTVYDTDEFNELKNRLNEESQRIRRNFNQNIINEAKGDGNLESLSPKQLETLRINDPNELQSLIDRRVNFLSSKNYDELSESDIELLKENNMEILEQIINNKINSLKFKTLSQISNLDKQFLEKYNKISDYKEHSHNSSKHTHIIPNPLVEKEILINDFAMGIYPYQDNKLKNNFKTSKNFIFNIQFTLGTIDKDETFFYIFSVKKTNTIFTDNGNRNLLIFSTKYNNKFYIYVSTGNTKETLIEYEFPYSNNINSIVKINVRQIFNNQTDKYELYSELKLKDNNVNPVTTLPILVNKNEAMEHNCEIFIGTDEKTLEGIPIRPERYDSASNFSINKAEYIRLPNDINKDNYQIVVNHTKEITAPSFSIHSQPKYPI